jgi:hypothetical protein
MRMEATRGPEAQENSTRSGRVAPIYGGNMKITPLCRRKHGESIVFESFRRD